MNRAVRTAVAVMVGWLLALMLAPVATAAPAGQVRLAARIDGRLVGDGRLIIDPSRPVDMAITVSNDRPSPIRVKTVRLSGAALGLTFFAYDTTVAFDVPPGAAVTRSFPLDLADLGRQATGLLPASVRLLGPDRAVLAEVSADGDVRGSMWSVYGVFGMAVVIVTLLALATVLAALARNRLPANRWRRAVRFLPAGFGVGLSAVVTLSVTRLVAPAAAAEIPLVLGCAAAALALGYLTPPPSDGPAPDALPGDGQPGAPADDAAPGNWAPGMWAVGNGAYDDTVDFAGQRTAQPPGPTGTLLTAPDGTR